MSELRYIDIDALLDNCKRRDPLFVPMEFDEKVNSALILQLVSKRICVQLKMIPLFHCSRHAHICRIVLLHCVYACRRDNVN